MRKKRLLLKNFSTFQNPIDPLYLIPIVQWRRPISIKSGRNSRKGGRWELLGV